MTSGDNLAPGDAGSWRTRDRYRPRTSQTLTYPHTRRQASREIERLKQAQPQQPRRARA
jgi:hypothetical protein